MPLTIGVGTGMIDFFLTELIFSSGELGLLAMRFDGVLTCPVACVSPAYELDSLFLLMSLER